MKPGAPPAAHRVAIYSRVSRKDQSAAGQVNQLNVYAKARGWTVVAHYLDFESGSSKGRNDFQAMMQAAARGEFDTVLFWSLDRFSREGLLPTLQHLQKLQSYGVGWWNYQHPDTSGTGIQGQVFLAVSAIWADYERQLISQRTKAALEVARAKGKKLGRPRAVLDQAKVQELHAQGRSAAAIARQLRTSEATIRRRLQKPQA